VIRGGCGFSAVDLHSLLFSDTSEEPERQQAVSEHAIHRPMITLAKPRNRGTASAKRFLRILYADDLCELRDIARVSLSRDGHGIECVEDGQIALNRVTSDPSFDLVITDHHMPNMTGLALVNALRNMNFPGKIVVFSSELSPAVAAEYARLKVDRILFKPVFPSVLRLVLAELFPNSAGPGKPKSAG
jgi:two-component system, chemotaxis family, chemotaxis protein CheY